MVAVEGKPSPRILGGKRRRSTTSISSVASHNEHRSLTNDQYEQGWIVDAVVSLCRGGENIRSIPVVQSSESPYNFVASCLCGENNSIGSGGDSRCDGISADNIVVADCLNNIGLDQFGRIANQNWVNSAGTTVDGYTYTYDQNSNVTAKNNALNSAYSETYTYDVLNRLTAVTRGGAAYQSWNLDSQGNWSSSTTGTVTQTETANAQNQITSISGSTTPTYDANGDMTTDQAGNKLVYDAWNRLISVTNSAGQLIAAYTYDARGYRVSESYPVGGNGVAAGTTKYLYYSNQEQVVEERWNGTASGNTQYQYVWSPSYVNAIVLRDTYASGVLQANSRIYTAYDANYDVTALIGYNSTTQTWGVTERFAYSPYGTVSVLDVNWNATTDRYSWQYMYKGGRQDPITGLYHFDHREYSASLGRFISQDPLQYVNGANTYQFVGSDPVGQRDPKGQSWTWWSTFITSLPGAVFQQAGNVASNIGNTVAHPVNTYNNAVDNAANVEALGLEDGGNMGDAALTGTSYILGNFTGATAAAQAIAGNDFSGQSLDTLQRAELGAQALSQASMAAAATGSLLDSITGDTGTMTVNVGPTPESNPYGFHVSFGTQGTVLGANGTELGYMRIGNETGFEQNAFTAGPLSFDLPVVDEQAILAMRGQRCLSCVTAAGNAWLRAGGWRIFLPGASGGLGLGFDNLGNQSQTPRVGGGCKF